MNSLQDGKENIFYKMLIILPILKIFVIYNPIIAIIITQFFNF